MYVARGIVRSGFFASSRKTAVPSKPMKLRMANSTANPGASETIFAYSAISRIVHFRPGSEAVNAVMTERMASLSWSSSVLSGARREKSMPVQPDIRVSAPTASATSRYPSNSRCASASVSATTTVCWLITRTPSDPHPANASTAFRAATCPASTVLLGAATKIASA